MTKVNRHIDYDMGIAYNTGNSIIYGATIGVITPDNEINNRSLLTQDNTETLDNKSIRNNNY